MQPKIKFVFIVISISLLAGFQTGAWASSTREYQIKAAFLYNFTKFIDWPSAAFPNSDTPIIVGILGSDPFGASLAPLRQKRVKGRGFIIKRFVEIDQIESCHILFINHSEKEVLESVFQTLKGRCVLTVGDTKDFARMGGIINFVKIQNKIRFEINTAAAKQADLIISSKMLKLARIVGENSK